jgi:regulator of protease activity HflC (stomatin/prohibitin superfamily)
MRLLMVCLLAMSCVSCATVPAKHVGVIEVFGDVQEATWGPGLHLWMPWQGVHRIDCRTVQVEQKTNTPTSEGLSVGLDVSLLFHVDPEQATTIYAQYGGVNGLYERVIQPQIRSSIRDATARFKAADLYSRGRDSVAILLNRQLRERLVGRPVVIEDVLLRDVDLPQQLLGSIEAKLQADQEAQKMEFVLARERQEAERKRVEAKGIADFQLIVANGITPSFLRWKGIEATEKLAMSQNSKVVIIGSSKDGLPIILGQ